MENVVKMLKCPYCCNEHETLASVDGYADMCEDCLGNTLACWRCAAIVFDNVAQVVGGGYWCEACVRRSAFSCDRCNDLFDIDESCEVEGDAVCQHCVENHANWCDDCEIYNWDGCGNEHRHRYIHDYSWTPDELVFHPGIKYSVQTPAVYRPGYFRDESRLVPIVDNTPLDKSLVAHFGIELETECVDGSVSDGAEWFSSQLGVCDAYLKHDSSINNGFEIVTQPRTLESWREFATTWGDVLNGLNNQGFRAWRHDNVGLHVNVSRIAFGGPGHVSRFGLLFGFNQPDWERIAARSTSYASFARLREGGIVLKAHTGHECSHFDAVNMSHADRIEVRIFRPSIKNEFRTLAAIEWVHAAMEYTRSLTSKDVTHGALSWNNFATFVRDNNYNYATLVENNEQYARKAGN